MALKNLQSMCFTITVSLPRIIATVYKSASFTCTVCGFGLMKVIWKRINCSLPITSHVTAERSFNKLSSTLKISDIVGYYSGQYYCVAGWEECFTNC